MEAKILCLLPNLSFQLAGNWRVFSLLSLAGGFLGTAAAAVWGTAKKRVMAPMATLGQEEKLGGLLH
jgi:hypothetical protein